MPLSLTNSADAYKSDFDSAGARCFLYASFDSLLLRILRWHSAPYLHRPTPQKPHGATHSFSRNARLTANNFSSTSVCPQWQPKPRLHSRPNRHTTDLATLSICGLAAAALTQTRADPHLCNVAFPKNNSKLVASIAPGGQRIKICGTSDHSNVDPCPNQALAKLAQVMFDQSPPCNAIDHHWLASLYH